METTDCSFSDNCIHCTLFDSTICISKFCEPYARTILNDVILLQNVFKLIIPIDTICRTCIILKTYDNSLKIELELPTSGGCKYFINTSDIYLRTNIDNLIAILDDKFPNLRRENCSKMAMK